MDEAMKIDGFDEAISGTACIWQDNQKVNVFVYSGEAIVKTLMERDGMSEDEALEYIDFNTEGAYVGPTTPIVMWEFQE